MSLQLSEYELRETGEITPTVAHHKYIQLEKEYNSLVERISNSKSRRQKDQLNKHKRHIRHEQNLLYPLLVEGQLVAETQAELGFARTSQVLYKRVRNGR